MKPNAGKKGFLLGVLAVIFTLIAAYAHAIYNPDDWFIFDCYFKDYKRIIPSIEWQAKPASIFSLTEENLIFWTFYFGIVLGFFAIVYGLLAEIKKEETFYSANAIVFGSTAFIFINEICGYTLLILCFITVFIIRRKET